MYIGITDHVDFFDWHPKESGKYEYEPFMKEVSSLKKEFPGLLAGAEVGEPHLFPEKFEKFMKGREFDYILGSVHHVNEKTPVYDKFFYSYDSHEAAYRAYFAEVKKLVSFGGFDAAAHLDIVHRRGANFYKEYTYEKFKDQIDEIIRIMVDKNIAMEINTSGLRYDAKDILPSAGAVKAYLDAGGHMLTVGSDAHVLKDTFFGIEKAYKILESIGVKELTVFKNRKPEKIALRTANS